MTFDQFDYFSENKPAEVKKIFRTLGLSQMNTLAANTKSMQYPALVVEDAPDLKLDLEDKNFEDQQHTFYVLCHAPSGDGSARAAAFKTAYTIGKQIILNMNPTFSKVDKSEIVAFKVGPLGDGAFGYGFSYGVSEE